MIPPLFIFLIPTFCILILFNSHYTSSSSQNPVLRTPINPNATTLYDSEDIVNSFQLKVNESVFRHESNQRRRRVLLGGTCSTGNPIDDCWRCDPNWASNRQKLADCGIGFGKDALGGRNGRIYVVTDSSDGDAVNPKPGTLRHAAIQTEPLWITFRSDMTIKLKEELLLNSFKTIDGRGAHVHITGGCITIQYVSNIIIHGVLVHDCVPVGNAIVRSTPDHFGWRGVSDGDGISIFQGTHIWVDHVAMARCRDGLIDAIMGSTAITISNSYFAEHNEVMLMGHSDDYSPDSSMQVTIAFNRFGEKLVQRMPRCRLGYFHIVNNDYTEWEMYAIGGSANPTINSQGNRYRAPADPNAREVTKRVDSDEKDWVHWNWRTEGDQMVNGAFFLPSGVGLSSKYEKASSLDPKSAGLIDQLTINAGVLGYSPASTSSAGGGGYNTGEGSVAAGNGGGGAYMGMTFSDGGASRSLSPPDYTMVTVALYLCLHLYNI